MSPMICPKCGRKPSFSMEDYKYHESGLTNVIVKGTGIFRCQCGEEYIQIPGITEVQDEIGNAVLKKSSLLIGREVKFLRKWLRLTAEKLGALLSVSRMTVSRWENSEPPPNKDRSIRLLAASMKGISLDAQEVFRAIKARPARNVSIIIDRRPREMQDAELAVTLALSVKADIDFACPTFTAQIQEFEEEPKQWVDAANQELAQVA